MTVSWREGLQLLLGLEMRPPEYGSPKKETLPPPALPRVPQAARCKNGPYSLPLSRLLEQGSRLRADGMTHGAEEHTLVQNPGVAWKAGGGSSGCMGVWE